MQKNINPFIGLRSFDESEHGLFFGRKELIKKISGSLLKTGFTTIIGSSGIGKSSLIKSGVVPFLRRNSEKSEGNNWKIAVFTPGYDPIGNLTSCLIRNEIIKCPEGINESDVSNIIRSTKKGIGLVLHKYLCENTNNILLFVDQFEEIFRFANSREGNTEALKEAEFFVNLLLDTTPLKGVYIVLALRSDFLDNCIHYPGLPEALNNSQYLVPKMSIDDFKLLIIRPIKMINASITSDLLETLLTDFANKEGQLTILQHTLMRVVDFWKRESNSQGPINVEHYNAVGGLDKALTIHAEEAFKELNSLENKLIAELIFKSLTDINLNSRGIRRPCQLGDLAEQLNVSENKIMEIIDVFRSKEKSFLLPSKAKQIKENDLIDISHESLIWEWDRLKFWSQEEVESSKTFLNLCNSAELYQKGTGSLLTNPELEIALLWKEKNNPNEKWASRYDKSFVRAMNFLSQSSESYSFQILQKELAQKNKIRKTKIFSIIVSIVFIISLSLVLASWVWLNDA